MNKKKLNYHQQTVNDLNLNSIQDQTQSFLLQDSQIMKLTTQINQQNLRINQLIKTIDDSRQEQHQKFNQHYLDLFNSNSKQYNQQILKEISALKQQFDKIEETQPNEKTKLKTHYYSHLPPLQSSQFEQQNSEKKEQLIYQQTQNLKNNGIKSSSIYEKEIKDLNQQIQLTKQSHSTHQKSKQNYSKNKYIKTEASPPQSSNRKTSTIMSRQKKRTQKLDNSNHFNYFQDGGRIHTNQSIEQDKLKIKSQQKNQFYKNNTKKLLRRFKVVSICVWLSVTLLKYCQKIWQQKFMIFKDWSQELIGQYDSQFNYQLVVDKFYKECILKKLIDKSWVFKSQSDIQIKCHNILIALEIFFKNLIVQSLNISIDHINFIQRFSLKKGYLLSGHSRFVINRIKVRPNNTLNITNYQQTQMIILEYSYIQILLPLIVEGEFWIRMPNYKESLKIFVSILHYLYIEAFQNIPLIQQTASYDDDCVPLFDFSRNPNDGFYQLINSKHPKYSNNKDGVVLGLYNKVELHPIILHNGYKNIRDSFRQYCDYILSLIL